MNFELDSYKDRYNFFHVKYGRGATLIAIEKGYDQEALIQAASSFHYKYIETDPVISGEQVPILLPVVELVEEKDHISLTIQDNSIECLIKRLLPKSQVTFEVYT